MADSPVSVLLHVYSLYTWPWLKRWYPKNGTLGYFSGAKPTQKNPPEFAPATPTSTSPARLGPAPVQVSVPGADGHHVGRRHRGGVDHAEHLWVLGTCGFWFRWGVWGVCFSQQLKEVDFLSKVGFQLGIGRPGFPRPGWGGAEHVWCGCCFFFGGGCGACGFGFRLLGACGLEGFFL